MDKIVELIIIFYLISAFLRFLKKSQKTKDQSYPSPRPRPVPPPQPQTRRREEPITFPPLRGEGQSPLPSPQPSSRRVVEMPRRPVFTSKKDQDALDILAEWERRASGQRAGTQREGSTGRPEVSPRKVAGAPPPPKKVEVTTVKGPMKWPGLEIPNLETSPREVISTFQPIMPKVKKELKPPSLKEPEVSGEEIAEERLLFFGSQAMLRQGIIMSEILRPPLARRDSFLLPYMRG